MLKWLFGGRSNKTKKDSYVDLDLSNIPLPDATLSVLSMDNNIAIDVGIKDYSEHSIKQMAKLIVYTTMGMKNEILRTMRPEFERNGKQKEFNKLLKEIAFIRQEFQKAADIKNDEPVLSPLDLFN